MLERALVEEMTGHLAYDKHDPVGGDPADDPPGAVPVQPLACRSDEDRSFAALADGKIDRARAVRGASGMTAFLPPSRAVLLGGWFTATAVIAGHGWYHTLQWLPIAVTGFLGTLLALSRIPVVARAIAAPGMGSRLMLPHSFRVAGVAFLLYLALGHLPALCALPADLGDIAVGIAAPLAARRLGQGTGRRAALWFNAFGLTELVVALTLGALTGFQLLNITPSSSPITELPLALIPTATVPLLIALHITSMATLVRAPRPARSAASPLTSGATPRTAVAPSPASRAR